ncbi:MAG TPA: DUF134 domain-containing protein [Williamwhitmania sp.]|jgi:predicted DNA-binding protein (UPF0251 family)|nr:DUF134 domain-containing protein [Williamwhitmania sp.]
MPRKKCCRIVSNEPTVAGFTPIGCERRKLTTIHLELDELDAIRSADFLGLYHEAAAEKMGVSRATFGRILAEARKKVAEALISGKKLTIESSTLPCKHCGLQGCNCHDKYLITCNKTTL